MSGVRLSSLEIKSELKARFGERTREQVWAALEGELASYFWGSPRDAFVLEVWGALEDHGGADLAFSLGNHIMAMLWREGRA